VDLCQEAADKIERAIREQPARLSEDVDEAECAVTRLRDELIDRLRGEPAADTSARAALLRDLLESDQLGDLT